MVDWRKVEEQANKLLGITHSQNLLLVDDMVPSDSYQYYIQERLIPETYLRTSAKTEPGAENTYIGKSDRYFTRKATRAGMIDPEVPESIRAAVDEIEMQLQEFFFWMVDNICTPHQQQIIQFVYLGLTQWEIAEKLGTNQSSVAKCLIGNFAYEGAVVKRYGGINKKMAKHMRKSVPLQSLMDQMEKLNPDRYRMRLPFYYTFRRVIGNSQRYYKWLNTQLKDSIEDEQNTQ